MDFILNRDHTLCTTLGHTIEFKKGEPVHVPHEVWTHVQAIGATPVEDLPALKVNATAEPEDPVARREAIMAGFAAMVEGGKRESFMASGSPHVKALASQIGFLIDNKERDALWTAFMQSKAGK